MLCEESVNARTVGLGVPLPPWKGRARVPTPLEARLDISTDLGVDLLLKREDLIDDLGCGHKARKLGYVVSKALGEQATVLITSGSVPSSQCVAVAAAARQHGLRAHLVYAGDRQVIPDRPQGNYLLATLLGPSISWYECSPWSENSTYVASVAERERGNGERPYVIEPGASEWPGLAGSIDLGLELVDQLGQSADESWIVAPAGSGGTCLGLSIAARLAGVRWRVAGICIGGTRAAIEQSTAALRERALEVLAQGDLAEARVSYYEDALGAGYDEATDDELETMRQALGSYQLMLDPNYMLKTFLGVRKLIDGGEIGYGTRVVLVHTGGSLGIYSSSPSIADWYRRSLSVYLSESVHDLD